MDYPKRKEIEGLGGWLILIGFVVLCSPIMVLKEISSMFMPIFNNWDNFPYHLQQIMIVEFIINILVILMWIVVAYLFFSKSPKFPGSFIGLVLFCLVFIFVDSYVTSVVFGGPILDEESRIKFFSTAVKSAIFSTYILSSDRVYNTFLKCKSTS